MQKFQRVLVVLVAILSVAFMGFAGVVSFATPNWTAEFEQIEGYVVTQVPGEVPVWKATRLSDKQELATKSANPAAVLTAVYQDQATRADETKNGLIQNRPAIEAAAKIDGDSQYADSDALRRYDEAVAADLVAIRKQLEDARIKREQLQTEVKKIEDRVTARREDVFRLETEHQLVQADLVQLRQNVKALEEQIVLLEDELDKGLRREQFLTEQGTPPTVDSVSRLEVRPH